MKIISEREYDRLYMKAKERKIIVDGLFEGRFHIIVYRLTSPSGEITHIASKVYDVEHKREYPNFPCFVAMQGTVKRKCDFLELSDEDAQELRLPFFP